MFVWLNFASHSYLWVPKFSSGVHTVDNKKKILFLANSDWYLYNFRLPLINDLIEQGYKLHLAPLENMKTN